MAQLIPMPKLGLTAQMAIVAEWRVPVGNEVSEGEILCDLETDKAMSELESPVSGVLLAAAPQGAEVPVGEPIAIIGAADESVDKLQIFGAGSDESAPAPETPASADPESQSPSIEPQRSETGRRRPVGWTPISPVARRLATDLKIEIPDDFVGSGPGGRIKGKDIKRLAAATGEKTATSLPAPRGKDEVVPVSRMRRAIATAMSASAAIPQFVLDRYVDVTDLETKLRADSDKERPGMADAIAVATARAIREHESFMHSWAEDQRYLLRARVNIGIAVAVDGGLVVPVIEDADHLSPREFAARRRGAQAAAARGNLGSGQGSAVFTISNLGPFGIDRFQALVNPGESGILAIGATRSFERSRRIALVLSADHRVVDGVDGARLLESIAKQLEPSRSIAVLEGGDGVE